MSRTFGHGLVRVALQLMYAGSSWSPRKVRSLLAKSTPFSAKARRVLTEQRPRCGR